MEMTTTSCWLWKIDQRPPLNKEMIEKVLRAEPLRFYQYYLGPLDEVDEVVVTQLTDKDFRFLLSSRRIHNTLYLKSRHILLSLHEFYIQEASTYYFHPNPIVLATLSLLHREKSRSFRMILQGEKAEDERSILKFMFWAKRNSLNFLLDSTRQSKLLSQVMHDLDYEIKGSASFGGTFFYDYVPGLDTVLRKFAKDQNTVFLHGSVLKPGECIRGPCKKAYLWGLFGDPRLTKLILDHIDGFVLCHYSPFPQMPNLRRITSTLLLGSIGSVFSFQYYHDLLAEFEVKAPNCHLHFVRHSLKVLAASYEAHAGVLQQLTTALKNMIQLATRFKNVRFEFTVDFSLTESAQSHREEWLHVVEPLTASCDIGFEKNSWIYKPDLSAFHGQNTGLQFELEYYFRNSVLRELNDQVLRVLE